MLATVGGTLALLLGLLLLLLPLLVNELSRPRDSVWGAVVLLLGLVLVTSADRLTGAPMLAVLCGGLLIGRLSCEVGQSRWRQLSDEERQLLASRERWSRSAQQFTATCGTLLSQASAVFSGLATLVSSRPPRPVSAKRWVRPERPEPGSGQQSQDGRERPEPASLAEEPSRQPQPTAQSQQTAAEDNALVPDPGTGQTSQLAGASTSAPRPPEAPGPGFGKASGVSALATGSEAMAAASGLSGTGAPPLAAPLTLNDSQAPDSAGIPGSPAPPPGVQGEQNTLVVRDFAEISALLAAAPVPEAESSEAG